MSARREAFLVETDRSGALARLPLLINILASIRLFLKMASLT